MELTKSQLQFFDTFGYILLPGLMADCIDEIIDAFEEVWQTNGGGHDGKPHDEGIRSCIVPFIDQHERLCALLDDPRIEGLLVSILGSDFNYGGSDGNYYVGDTGWHSDGWKKREIMFVKVAIYLDTLRRDTGCIRVIPGSHRFGDTYADSIQDDIKKIPERWGMGPTEMPAIAVETDPGDILVFNHNLKHASFGGSKRRRMFTINCGQRANDAQLPMLREYIAGGARFWLDHMYGETMVRTAGTGRMVHLEQCMANEDHLPALAAAARAEMPEPAHG